MTHTFIKAALAEPVAYTPIWIMRQAGRYLPEYRKTRERAGSFLNLCKTPDLACEVTLQPIIRYPLDAAILFSDILTIPDAMGLGLSFVEGEGPKFAQSINHINDIKNLTIPDPNTDLVYVMDAIKLIQKELNQKLPLIGFSGSPWTLAAYMLEGGSSKDFAKVKTMQAQAPEALHLLLEKLSIAVSSYLNAQIEAGVDTIMIFDSWGGLLEPQDYSTFSLSYIQKALSNIKNRKIPSIVYARGASNRLEQLSNLNSNVIGIDENTDLKSAKAQLNQFVLQGNFNTQVLTQSEANIRAEVAKILETMGPNPKHIFNLGHGITPDIDPGKLGVLIHEVHEQSKAYHKQ